MKLFDILSEFLNDKPEMKLLQKVDGQAFLSYLTDIFEKLNMLNKQLEGTNKTLVDAKPSLQFCDYMKRMFHPKNLTNFIG
jgi:hypothetical protein